MIIKFGPLTFAIAHTHMPWRMLGAKVTFAIKNGIFQHEVNAMVFGTGFAWCIDREPSSPITLGISLVLATIPATIGLTIGSYKPRDAAEQDRLVKILGDLLDDADPCTFDADGQCLTHKGGVLVNPTDAQKNGRGY